LKNYKKNKGEKFEPANEKTIHVKKIKVKLFFFIHNKLDLKQLFPIFNINIQFFCDTILLKRIDFLNDAVLFKKGACIFKPEGYSCLNTLSYPSPQSSGREILNRSMRLVKIIAKFITTCPGIPIHIIEINKYFI
jgi:hypothetical protein